MPWARVAVAQDGARRKMMMHGKISCGQPALHQPACVHAEPRARAGARAGASRRSGVGWVEWVGRRKSAQNVQNVHRMLARRRAASHAVHMHSTCLQIVQVWQILEAAVADLEVSQAGEPSEQPLGQALRCTQARRRRKRHVRQIALSGQQPPPQQRRSKAPNGRLVLGVGMVFFNWCA